MIPCIWEFYPKWSGHDLYIYQIIIDKSIKDLTLLPSARSNLHSQSPFQTLNELKTSCLFKSLVLAPSLLVDRSLSSLFLPKNLVFYQRPAHTQPDKIKQESIKDLTLSLLPIGRATQNMARSFCLSRPSRPHCLPGNSPCLQKKRNAHCVHS